MRNLNAKESFSKYLCIFTSHECQEINHPKADQRKVNKMEGKSIPEE
jgi:hypothetical protein